MIKVLIFDLGGVIIKHKVSLIEDIISEIFPHNTEAVIKIWSKYRQLLNTGKKNSYDFFLELKKTIPTQLNPDEVKHKWKERYKKEADQINWDLLNYIGKLKKRYKVFLFTDTIDIHDEYNRTRNIYDKFHKVYISVKEGVAKAEGKSAFMYILENIQAKPKECIFIDDQEKNVNTARDVGMKGIIYINLKKLRDKLVSWGVCV